jgi:CubicO group peptidase (beta-lactamase class C family)/surface polysaccharide O-acyltransferase-like enzyme
MEERERFLDAVRALAVVRVMVWHAFGFAAITYVVSAVPAMFFVTGSLLARSLDRHGYRATLRDRARRLLLPLWLFSLVAFATMALADLLRHDDAARVPWRNLVWWIVPLDDPAGSQWEGGWLSSPLWYLRALLWLIVVAPLLLRATRRAPAGTLFVLTTAVFTLDVAARHPRWPLQTTRVPWIVGDFFLYAIFLCLGFLHRDGVLARLDRRRWTALALASAAVGALWIATQPVPGFVVNDSHPAHLLVGFAWLALFLAASRVVERVAANALIRDLIRTVNSRSLTIYLWHSTAIILGYQLLWNIAEPMPKGVFTASVVGLMFAGTAAFVALFGWCEDVAGRRRPQLWPGALARSARPSGRVREPQGRRVVAGALAVSGVCTIFTVAATSVEALSLRAPSSTTVSATSAASHTLRTPSQAPAPPRIGAAIDPVVVMAGDAEPATDAVVSTSTSTDDRRRASLVATARAWLLQNGVSGVQFGVGTADSLSVVDSAGTLTVDDPYDIFSVTKTMTATLVLREVEAGRLDLDAPLPVLTAVPTFPSHVFTVRELLSHATGLVNYRDTPQYAANPAAITTPAEALATASAQPLLFEPGTKTSYSSTNFLVLGLLLEDVTGLPFEQLLRESILEPLGLDSAQLTPSQPGEPNFSTGGLVVDTADLLTWTSYYFRDHAGLSAATWAMMTTIDPSSSLGSGIIGYCPCTRTGDGEFQWKGLGYAGSTTLVQYSPTDDVAIVINLSEPLWKSDAFFNAVVGLFEAFRTVVDTP